MKLFFKRIMAVVLTGVLSLSLFSGCSEKVMYDKYTGTIWDSFDTIISIVSYQKSQADFDEFMETAQSEYTRLNQLYDIYNSYPDLNNAKTINDNAGIAPVKVSKTCSILSSSVLTGTTKPTAR